LRFSVLKADLLKGVHFVFDLVLQEKSSDLGGTVSTNRRISLRIASRLMLPGSTVNGSRVKTI
jgi:hypothetical protein